jgi:hypothetical protein
MFATSAVLILVLFGWYRWDSSRNRSYEFGYYGEFNCVSNSLRSIPGVAVTRGWHNHDVSLEEFGFDVTVSNTPVRLGFEETDPIRKMKHDAAVTALKNLISAEIASSLTNKEKRCAAAVSY